MSASLELLCEVIEQSGGVVVIEDRVRVVDDLVAVEPLLSQSVAQLNPYVAGPASQFLGEPTDGQEDLAVDGRVPLDVERIRHRLVTEVLV